MEDNKKDYSDFFKRSDEQNQEPEQKQERPSYYYSYGPYKSSMQDSEQNGETAAASNQNDEYNSVEVTAPRPVRPVSFGNDPQPQQPVSTWTVNEPRKRSTIKTAFTAFIAGAVVVGSLMFVSDKMNLFTGDRAMTGAGAGGSAPGASSPSGGAAKAASYDISRPGSIPQIAEKSSPAVVLVEAYVKQKQRSSRSGSSLYDDPWFRYFFGDNGGGQQPTQPNNNNGGSGGLQKAGIGSGFIFEQSGYILTNEHVVDGADEVHVVMEGVDKPYTAKVIGTSYDYDLAVLKIEGDKAFPTLPIASADETAIGDWVVAIGNPLGFDHTVTVGVLSAKMRDISIPDSNGTRNYKHLLQTDASINPGNSGGPLLNMNGEVIGINTAVSSQAQGIGFAIPTSTINDLLPNLKTGTKIPRPASPFVGVTLQDLDQQTQKLLSLDSTDGAMVQTVLPGGPAFKAGVKQYDVVVAANGVKVTNTTDLKKLIQATKVGDKMTLAVVRDGKKIDIAVTIGDQNNDPATQQQP